jgi:hypothetical protein
MCCSDFPHSEGTTSPIDDYAATQPAGYAMQPDASPGFFGDNVGFLLRR